jgi:putative addiction module component (TIGR02574 family)
MLGAGHSFARQIRQLKTACIYRNEHYFLLMPLTNLAVAEEALSLSPDERANLAKLLIQSLESDGRSDAEITAELRRRLDGLISGSDPGLNFEQVFGHPA